MAETNALIGYGVQLSRSDGGSPESFTALAEVIDLTTPSMTKDQIEATHTDSPDGFREYIPGLKDGGEFTATCNFLPDNATQNDTSGGAFNDFVNETTSRNWKITFPGSPEHSMTFKATIIGWEVTSPMDDRMTLAISFKVAGAPTYA